MGGGAVILSSLDDMHAMEQKNKLLLAAVVVAVIAVALAASCFLLPDSSHEPRAKIFPQPFQDGDKDYPSAAEAQEMSDDLIASLESSLSDGSLDVTALGKAISEAEGRLCVLQDKLTWVTLDYHEDPPSMKSEYQAWDAAVGRLERTFASAIKDALSGPCSSAVEAALKAIGKDPEYYRAYGETTPEQEALLQRQSDLKAQYDTVIGTKYEVTDAQGRTWTLDTVSESTTLTDEEKRALTAEIYAEQYTDAAAVYVELVQVNNDYAKLKGYGNYAEYAYKETYNRDYTVSDAKSLSQLTSRAYEISENAYELAGYTSEKCKEETAWMYELDADGLIDAMEPFIRSVSSDHSRLLDYMEENGLLYICDGENRIKAAYSTDIKTRGAAIVYMGTVGRGPDTVIGLVHEFGHSSNTCLTPNRSSCYDVFEIHSQGLEALYCASGMAGNGSDKAVSVMKMKRFASLVASSSLLTEFEIWAYETQAETGSLTVDQACDKFASILESHGIVYKVPYDQKYYWAHVMHLFKVPHYYVSYCTSVFNAMEVYLDALQDYGSAKEKYLGLLYQENVEGYVAAVEKAGYSNALDHEGSARILDGIEDALRAIGSRCR